MRRRRFTVPISIVAFLALTLVGTYFVRRRILEKHMLAAMDMNDEAAVLSLARAFPCPVNARTTRERTPLHWAASNGSKDLVSFLISRGACVNAKDNDWWMPLHWAVWRRHKDVAELLISHGADLNAKNKQGWTPLHHAVIQRDKEAAALLIAQGADVNARDWFGESVLGCAKGHEGLAELLRKHGAKE